MSTVRGALRPLAYPSIFLAMTATPALPAIDGLLLDLDGTLYLGDRAIPGAVNAVRVLRDADVPCRFLTNTTRRSRTDLAAWLQRLGFPIEEPDLFTAAVSAARWLESEGVERVSLYLAESTYADFRDFDVVDDRPDAIVVGDLGERWDFALLNRAFRQLLEGARLVALQRNRYWRTERGLELDAGPFVAALEYAVDTEAVVVGKPSPAFFRMGARSLGLDGGRIAVVGDDVETDVAGALDAGMVGVLVRTGKHTEERLAASGAEPDAIIDSVAELPGLMEENR